MSSRRTRIALDTRTACNLTSGLIKQVDEKGATKLLASGNPKRERSRLELMAALEFVKLHGSVATSAPKQADERIAKAYEAIRYARGQWEALGRFLEDSALPLDDNASEGAFRTVALGRKDFLFGGHDETLCRASRRWLHSSHVCQHAS